MKSVQTSKFPCRTFHLLLGFIAAAFLGGCSFLRPHDDPTRFYVLTVPHAATRFADSEFKRLKIGLKPVEVPAYLRSKSMVVRTGTNEIHFAEFDRWAEPLDQGIGRAMKENLSAARNVASVTLNSHGDDTLYCEVAIRILTCEGVRVEKGTSLIRFAATWEFRPVGTNLTVSKRGGFTADDIAWSGKDYGQLAERISEAIASASISLAADLPMEAKLPPKATPEIVKP
jgi:uncharacterized lipoprotein YmbA